MVVVGGSVVVVGGGGSSLPTMIDTVEPLAAGVPAVGLWLTTLPACAEPNGTSTSDLDARKPAAWSWSRASDSVSPVTIGTPTWGGPLDTTIVHRACPCSRPDRPAGRCG